MAPSLKRPSSSAASGTADGGQNKKLKQVNLFSFFGKKPAASNKSAPSSSQQAAQQSAAVPPAAVLKKNPLLEQVTIGTRIEVFWEDDDEWYGGKVTKRLASSFNYFLVYDDGQCEWIDLDNQTFRIAKDKTSGKRRRIQDDDDDDSEQEAEFSMDEGDDDESAYEQEENTGNDDDDDDQWMVTDDEDDQEVVSGRSKAKKQKTDKKKMSAPKKSSSSLGSFAAPSSFTVTEHGTGKTPVRTSPATSAAFTPKQITPATGGPFSTQRKTPVLTPSLTSTSSSPSASSPTVAKPPMFVKDALNPAGSHVHHHLPFLRRPRDARDRDPDHPEYDPRTLKVVESDWKRVTGKPMTDAVKQWWDLKAQYFDTVLLFKTGKFYEIFHMDADIGVQVCNLAYMKGHVAHVGFPEVAYGKEADKLVRAGYKVARVEQTETPEQLKERKKKHKGKGAPKVVNREVCSVMTTGTRTFCFLDSEEALADDGTANGGLGPLLSIREVLVEASEEEEEVQPVCEYGITLVDAVRGTVTIGQFADDALRSRMTTLLTAFGPSEILLEGGKDGASPTLLSLIRSLQLTNQQKFRIEIIRPTENFPKSTAIDAGIRRQMERGSGPRNEVHPWDVEETLDELHRRRYYPRASKKQEDKPSVTRWPQVLRAAVEGHADLALSSFGAALFYLQRSLIDAELLSLGIVKAYIPPESSTAVDQKASGEIRQLAAQQNREENEGSAGPTLDHHVDVAAGSEFDISHMSLDGTTLHNLEILTNLVDFKVAGSLWSKINYTKTPHGSRLLRAWLLRPLFRKADIDRRADAVQELVSGGAAVALADARSVLSKVGDIERLLTRVHSMSGTTVPGMDGEEETDRIHPNDRAVLYENAIYTKRKVEDFSKALNGLRCATQIPELFNGVDVQSGLLRKIVQFADAGGCFPDMVDELDWFFENFDCDKAAKGNFTPSRGVDQVYDDACESIERIEKELKDYQEDMCRNVLKPSSLARTSWKYQNCKPDSKDKYIIELSAGVAVPDDFIMTGKRGSGPKQVNKYRTPVVELLVKELENALEIQKERRERGMQLIFAKFDRNRCLWAAAAQATALLDALGALAQTASKAGYTRPKILDCPSSSSPLISISQGRHPCVEQTISSTEFIPNDLSLGGVVDGISSPRVLLLSGPNMGGKSTLLRQTCLITILAQIGCFVPATECKLTPVDRIFTRLGASDRILLGQSTFFVELAETAAALRGANRRSLVIMDELGRGTSTFDGTAIASATVHHLVERNKCLSLFATHYHSLLDEWKDSEHARLGHMECLVEERQDSPGSDEANSADSNITFLYTLGDGVCPKSFGIDVARIAGLPVDLLQNAKRISSQFEQEMSTTDGNRSIVRARDAADIKRRIEEAFIAEKWDEMLELWQSMQEA